MKRAIDIAEKSLKEDLKPIQFLGNLVHNEKVVEEIKRKEGKIISALREIKPGTLIIRAHGAPSLPKIKNVLVRDTTCPLVKRAQKTANLLFNQGYRVIIIGDKSHPEIRGIKKYAGSRAIVIKNELQVKSLPKIKKIGVVSQTTQDLNKVNRIIKILKNKTKELKWLNTICPEVISRQKELSQIVKKADGILVIGSQTSANTKRLADIARNSKRRVFWVNSLKDLKKQRFKSISTLGVVSGTSTPNWEIEKIKKYLKKYA